MIYQQLPWTTEGKQLLNELLLRIQLAGGREKLAALIEIESIKTPKYKETHDLANNHKPWDTSEVEWLLRYHKSDSIREIAMTLKRSEVSIEHKILKMKKVWSNL